MQRWNKPKPEQLWNKSQSEHELRQMRDMDSVLKGIHASERLQRDHAKKYTKLSYYEGQRDRIRERDYIHEQNKMEGVVCTLNKRLTDCENKLHMKEGAL